MLLGFLSRLCCCFILLCRSDEKKTGPMSCAILTLYLFNFLFLLVGLVSLTVGIFGTYLPVVLVLLVSILRQQKDDVTQVEEWVERGSLILFWLGVIMVIYGAVGLVAVYTRNYFLLTLYRLVILVVMIVEILICCTLVFFPDELSDAGSSVLQYSLKLYTIEKPPGTFSKIITETWDDMQTDLHCCGSKNYTEHLTKVKVLPPSCCYKDNSTKVVKPSPLCPLPKKPLIKEKGCYGEVLKSVKTLDMLKVVGMLLMLELNYLFLTFYAKRRGTGAESSD